MIRIVAFSAAILLVAFVWWEWRHPDPIVDLKLLANRNFGTAVFLQLILGMVLFGSTVLIPQYLQTLLGYTAERAGMVLSPAGFAMMIMMPSLAVLSAGDRSPAHRRLGYAATALGLYNLTRLSLDTQLWHRNPLARDPGPRPPLHLHPISTLNYVGVPRSKSNQISASPTSHATSVAPPEPRCSPPSSPAPRRRINNNSPRTPSPARCSTSAISAGLQASSIMAA